MISACEQHNAHFALVVAGFRNLKELAESLDEGAWEDFEPKARRHKETNGRGKEGKKSRRKREERRHKKARERGNHRGVL